MAEDIHRSNDEASQPIIPQPRRGRAWLILSLLFIVATGTSLYFYRRSLDGAKAAADNAAPPPAGSGMTAMPAPSSVPADSNASTGQIYIAPERQQLIGVKTASAEMKSITKEIRTVG